MRQYPPEGENMPPTVMNIPSRRTDQESPSGSPSGSPGHDGLTGYPVMEETIYSIQTAPDGRRIRIPVILKVYNNNFGGRYAVVGQNKVMCKDCGYINLKHCTIQTLDTVGTSETPTTRSPLSQRSSQPQYYFEIVSHKTKGQRLVFTVPSRTELEQWLSVLKAPEQVESVSPRVVNLSSMPGKHGGEFPSTRVASPRPIKKQQSLMPALEEE